MNRYTIVPDVEDFAEIDGLDGGLSPADRYMHAQNLKIHRLAEQAGWTDVFPGEAGKAN